MNHRREKKGKERDFHATELTIKNLEIIIDLIFTGTRSLIIPPQYREISHKNVSTRCDILSFRRRESGMLISRFLGRSCEKRRGGSSFSSFSSSSNRIDFRSRERYHPSTRREFDEGRPTHVGCTRARTCIGLKKRSRHPLFLRGIDIPNLFLDIVPQLLKPRLSSSVSFFRSDSDRG